MSSAKELEADRKKRPPYYPKIPDAKGYGSKQENYDVSPVTVEEPFTRGKRIFGTRPPKLSRKSKQGEANE